VACEECGSWEKHLLVQLREEVDEVRELVEDRACVFVLRVGDDFGGVFEFGLEAVDFDGVGVDGVGEVGQVGVGGLCHG